MDFRIYVTIMWKQGFHFHQEMKSVSPDKNYGYFDPGQNVLKTVVFCFSTKSTSRCSEDCGCEQKYKWHRLLAYDPSDDCAGIFMDWFLFPSCCVCRCNPWSVRSVGIILRTVTRTYSVSQNIMHKMIGPV